MVLVMSGALNTTALVDADLYVQIVPPANLAVNGVPSNVLGVVGTATWGPVNKPQPIGTMGNQVAWFGPVQNRKHDLGTAVAVATQQGANNILAVRVTDGNDVAATSAGVATCITFAALYTGSLGNSVTVQLAAGSKASSWKVIIGAPGYTAEVFDNITGSGNALWVAIAAAINSGSGVLRGASQWVTAAAGAGTTTATAATYTFSGGVDGAVVGSSNVKTATLVGVDTTTRTGMYALRGRIAAGTLLLADADDTTQWSVINAFGQSEACFPILAGPSGDSISNAVTTKQAAFDDAWGKPLFGDWCWWNDPYNGVQRVVHPAAVAAGKRASLAPHLSTLNKPLVGIIGTQRSGLGNTGGYSTAERITLTSAGIDFITNPAAGGLNIWAVREGINASSNASVQDETYTTMTNYIAATLNASQGVWIGQPINADLFRRIKASLDGFFSNMLGQRMLTLNADGSLPWAVICDASNNPQARTALGYGQADVSVTYMGTLRKFIINLQGGATVSTVTVARV
jgi:hypothetical protein